ncbi:hypothetical protein EMCRGX_G031468 [Ephydatia muelleri]
MCIKGDLHCINCSDIACNGSDTNVVCGTNGLTYLNQCELEKARCLQNDSFDIESFGPCLTLPPPPDRGVCLDHRNQIDISSERFRTQCDSAIVCNKLANRTLTTEEIFWCYRPNCVPVDGEYQYAPLQCISLCGWCWCSSPDGNIINGTLLNWRTEGLPNCDVNTCYNNGRSVQNGLTVSSGCGFCKCNKGKLTCHENFIPDAQGSLNSTQLIEFKREVLLLYFVQYINQAQLAVDVSYLDGLLIKNVPADIRSRILLWKFQNYDLDGDEVLLPPEKENVNNEIYNFVKCISILPQIDALMDKQSCICVVEVIRRSLLQMLAGGS